MVIIVRPQYVVMAGVVMFDIQANKMFSTMACGELSCPSNCSCTSCDTKAMMGMITGTWRYL